MSYQPPGGIAAPDYGQRPPRKSRAGLFIVLMVLLLVALLVSFALIATRVFTNLRSADPPPPAPVTSVAPVSTPKATAAPTPKVKPTPVETVPVKPIPITPAPADSAQVAARFVARVNANDAKGAAALGCADTKQSIPAVIDQFVRRPAALTASRAPVSSAGPIAVFSLSGTMKGATAGGILVVEVASQPCVKSFVVR